MKKLDIARRELCRQCIRIRDIKVGVPAGNALFDISRVVRHWIDTDVLQHDHRRTPPDNAKEDVVVTGPLKHDVEPETVAIKRQRGGDILNDEEWRNAGNFWLSHASFPSFRTFTPNYRSTRFLRLLLPCGRAAWPKPGKFSHETRKYADQPSLFFVQPHTRCAVSTTSRILAHCSSSVKRFPSMVEAKPHCGLSTRFSRGTYLAASWTLRIKTSPFSSCGRLELISPSTTVLPPGTKRRGAKVPE